MLLVLLASSLATVDLESTTTRIQNDIDAAIRLLAPAAQTEGEVSSDAADHHYLNDIILSTKPHCINGYDLAAYRGPRGVHTAVDDAWRGDLNPATASATTESELHDLDITLAERSVSVLSSTSPAYACIARSRRHAGEDDDAENFVVIDVILHTANDQCPRGFESSRGSVNRGAGAAPSNKARQLCVKREQLAPTSPRMRDAVQDVLVVGGATTLTKCPCGGWRAAALDSTMYGARYPVLSSPPMNIMLCIKKRAFIEANAAMALAFESTRVDIARGTAAAQEAASGSFEQQQGRVAAFLFLADTRVLQNDISLGIDRDAMTTTTTLKNEDLWRSFFEGGGDAEVKEKNYHIVIHHRRENPPHSAWIQSLMHRKLASLASEVATKYCSLTQVLAAIEMMEVAIQAAPETKHFVMLSRDTLPLYPLHATIHKLLKFKESKLNAWEEHPNRFSSFSKTSKVIKHLENLLRVSGGTLTTAQRLKVKWYIRWASAAGVAKGSQWIHLLRTDADILIRELRENPAIFDAIAASASPNCPDEVVIPTILMFHHLDAMYGSRKVQITFPDSSPKGIWDCSHDGSVMYDRWFGDDHQYNNDQDRLPYCESEIISPSAQHASYENQKMEAHRVQWMKRIIRKEEGTNEKSNSLNKRWAEKKKKISRSWSWPTKTNASPKTYTHLGPFHIDAIKNQTNPEDGNPPQRSILFMRKFEELEPSAFRSRLLKMLEG